MTGDKLAAEGDALPHRCRATVQRLAQQFAWRLDAAAAEALARAMVAAYAAESEPADRALEQTCCRLRFVRLYDDLGAGGSRAETALEELFQVVWLEPAEVGVRYGGYLYRSALITLRRRLAASSIGRVDLEQLACDAAGRAVTTVRRRFQDCRDPDAFWGWVGRVAERAAIDELRSGQATGGRSVHALSLDLTADAAPLPDSAKYQAQQAEDRQVDALAVRTELVRKCRLGKLSLDQREALVRGFWGGEKPREIAAALTSERGQPVSAAQVSLWKHRGLQVMEANLREHGFSPAQ